VPTGDRVEMSFMSIETPARARPLGLVKASGTVVVAMSLVGLVVGLLLARSLGEDMRSTLSVSQSALVAISDTVEAVDGVADDTAASLEAASRSVDSASATVDNTVSAIEETATFLDEDLPATIEAIQSSMPAAIQTANAIDGTLRALSFFGVDYNPEEPFGESLSQVNQALVTLPAELRGQSESLRLLLPSAEDLSADTAELSAAMDGLSDSLESFTELTVTYETTLAEAEGVIDRTGTSIETSLWMIRILVIGMGIAGLAVGVSLIVVGRSLEELRVDVDEVDELEEDTVQA